MAVSPNSQYQEPTVQIVEDSDFGSSLNHDEMSNLREVQVQLVENPQYDLSYPKQQKCPSFLLGSRNQLLNDSNTDDLRPMPKERLPSPSSSNQEFKQSHREFRPSLRTGFAQSVVETIKQPEYEESKGSATTCKRITLRNHSKDMFNNQLGSRTNNQYLNDLSQNNSFLSRSKDKQTGCQDALSQKVPLPTKSNDISFRNKQILQNKLNSMKKAKQSKSQMLSRIPVSVQSNRSQLNRADTLESKSERQDIEDSVVAFPSNLSATEYEAKGNVIVAIRIRPDDSYATQKCITLSSDQQITVEHKGRAFNFSFDLVADEHTDQAYIFNQIAKPIADKCLEGYNGTIFAYGQTGAGKTYTIQGPCGERNKVLTDETSKERGIMQRSFEYIFNCIREETK